MNARNIACWDEYGDYLIPVMPFMDNVIARSEGSYLIDVEGNKILDLASGQFCTILGHNHPLFIERLAAELKNNLHTKESLFRLVRFKQSRNQCRSRILQWLSAAIRQRHSGAQFNMPTAGTASRLTQPRRPSVLPD